MASLRQLLLVLLAILARPWTWLVLGAWVLVPALALVSLAQMAPSAPGAALAPQSPFAAARRRSALVLCCRVFVHGPRDPVRLWH